LAVILLVKATPSATDVRAVVSLGEQEGTFAGPAGSDPPAPGVRLRISKLVVNLVMPALLPS
jgi:hypothetical protein